MMAPPHVDRVASVQRVDPLVRPERAPGSLQPNFQRLLNLQAHGWRLVAVEADRDELLLSLVGEPGPVTLTLRALRHPVNDTQPAFWRGEGVALSHRTIDAARRDEVIAALKALVRDLAPQQDVTGLDLAEAAESRADTLVGAVASALATLRRRRATPLLAALDRLSTDAVAAGADRQDVATLVARVVGSVLDAGLPPHQVEPSLALADAALRITLHPTDPRHAPATRAEATVAFLAAFGVTVPAAPIAAFLAGRDTFVLVGAAVAATGARPKLYLWAPEPRLALREAVLALGVAPDSVATHVIATLDPRAHLVCVDFQADRRHLKSYVRLGAETDARLASGWLGPWLRHRGFALDALEVHECTRRDSNGHVLDRSLHVHFEGGTDAALAVAWAQARGDATTAARILALTATTATALRVLSETVGGGPAHAYFSLGDQAVVADASAR